MSGTNSTNGVETNGKQCVGGGRERNFREKNYLEDAGVDGRIIINWIFRTKDYGMDLIELTLNRDGWQTLANVTMNLRNL
jgi:hypothetical protein